MSQYAYINGKMLPKEQAFAPLYDHGLLYGDGLFEGIRTYNGRVYKLNEHLTRLYYSAAALLIKLSISQKAMHEAVLELCRANEHKNGYIRLTVTRGTGLGLDPSHMAGEPNVYITTEQLRLYPAEKYEEGLTMITASTRMPPLQVIDPRIKCTGKYTNNIQAKMEANRFGAGEAVMLTLQGYVAECTGDNLFIIKDGVVKTPPAHSCGLMGITRNSVIDLAHSANIPLVEEMMTQYDIYNAEECFLTGTGAEVIPAVSLDDRIIGSGRVGPVTHKLIGLFRQDTRESGDAF